MDDHKDLVAISDMISAAEDEGLTVEVVWSFAQDIAAKEYTDENVIKACNYALSEWDI